MNGKSIFTGFIFFAAGVIVFVNGSGAKADVKLPQIIGSSMVIQRDMPIQVWGWADAGEDVSVKFDANELSTKADSEGKWMVKLPAMKAGGPYQMTVKGKNTIELYNILIGDVWLCSGQSNMALIVRDTEGAEAEIASATHPQLRHFTVANTASNKLLENVGGTWAECVPANASYFSATAYYFGKELNKELNVPIGLINASYGGSRIEPWTPLADVLSSPSMQDAAKELKEAEAEYQKALKTSFGTVEKWVQNAHKAADSNNSIPLPPEMPKHPLTKMVPPFKPTSLYNAMIHPLEHLGIRGVIWYQGESNLIEQDNMSIYTDKMKVFVNSWRKIWKYGDLPFYYVQIAPWRYSLVKKDPKILPVFWQAQTAAMSMIPNSGMAVTIDIGDANDIHPRNKRDVGKRLALWALAKTYGKTGLVYSGPIYKSMSVEGNKIRVKFDYTGSGLVSRDDKPLSWFEIAGEDKKFVNAQAKIDGNSVVVWNESVAKPVAVRFAWYETAQPNLMNKEGLPASAFTTEKE